MKTLTPPPGGFFSRKFGRKKGKPAKSTGALQTDTKVRSKGGRLAPLRRLKLLPKTLSTIEWLMVLLAIVGFLGGATWWGLRNYLNSTMVVAEDGGSFNLGLVGQPRYINPLLAPTSDVDMDLSTLVFSSLFKLDKDAKIYGDLAESVSVSKDQKVYTVVLKPNLKWHDGQALTASDVVFTVKAIQDPNWQSPLNLGFKGVTAEQVDERTVKFTLQEVYAPFQSTLTFGILPEHLWASVPGANASLAELNTKPIGSGPYKFDELTKDKTGTIKKFHLVANQEYAFGRPHIDSLSVTFYDTPEDLVQAYKDNDVDTVGGIPIGDKESLQSANSQVLSIGLPRYDALFINSNNNTYLRPDAVRQALSHAIKKSELVEKVLLGNGVVVNSPLVPGSLGYTADVTVYGYDVEKAKALLTDDGWKFKDGRWFKDKDKLIVEIVTADTAENRAVAEMIKGYWEAIGIEVVIVNAPVAELQQTHIRERKYQALLFGEVIGADPDLYPFWHSTQIADPGLNLTSFSDDDLDQLLEEARQTTDPAKRAAKQTEISKLLAKELHAIFLYSPQYLMAVRDKIQGVALTTITIPADRFNDVQNWYIKTKRVPKDESAQ
jgi:peptide/nickel transport system substrate-binding protein